MVRYPFSKSLQELGFEDIQSLIEPANQARAENEILEYKEKILSRLELQKEILGFANNLGGYLILGIQTKKPENIPIQIIGVTKEENITETIINIVRDNSSPPYVPAIRLIPLPSDPTKCIIIIYSHESDTVHRASDGKYYYRTANETIPIRPEFITKIIGKDKIRSELEKVSLKFDWRQRSEFTGANIGHDGWFGIICCPIPLDSFKIPLFSETEWYRIAALNIMGQGAFDWRSYMDSFRVFKPRSGASPTIMVEFSENALIIIGYVMFYGFSPQILENNVSNRLDNFLKLIIKVYNKASFDGGLLIIASMNNIMNWNWSTGNNIQDMLTDRLPTKEPYLEVKHETTISAIELNIETTRNSIIKVFKRHFNLY